MTYREQVLDAALEHHGLVTTWQAPEIGVPAVEIRKLASRHFLERVGHGVYRVEALPRGPEAEFAEAVALAGPTAYLRADAVLALLNLASVNPRTLRVGTRERVRRSLPPTIDVTWEPEGRELTEYSGIPATPVKDALLDCVGLVMTSRLLDAAKRARAEGYLTPSEHSRLRRRLHAHEHGEAVAARKAAIKRATRRSPSTAKEHLA